MAQTSHPTLTNLPPPGSNPETPSEMPLELTLNRGTPTSTTTSLSALSTTAIKDGHRGHFPQGPGLDCGHQHSPSTTSLEAERADRISRLAGLERVSTVRAPPHNPSGGVGGGTSSLSPQTTPTSTGFPTNYPPTHPLTPAYFDGNGQPVAVTKMSTVGTASATESHVGEGSEMRGTAGERDEDMLSTDTNYREAESVASMGAYPDAMDEDLDRLGHGGYDDRMSDDGSASLVGFGEGAGSTVSGPIYHRRPVPNAAAAQQAGLGEIRRDRDIPMVSGSDTPVTATAMQERRDARMMDGVAADHPHGTPTGPEGFVDTTFRGPIPMSSPQARETAETIVQQLDHGEATAGPSALSSSGKEGQPLGKFYFEGEKRD
ncbi:hypothetical protein ACO1O0_007479 [Amphichorda felina]